MLEIFTVGGGEYLVNVLNAVAAWTGGGGFRSMLQVVMVMGLAYVLIVVAFSLDWRQWLRWFLSATLMYGALIVPTTSIKVTDRINPGLAPAIVPNVPIGLAAVASLTSQFGDWLTRTAETVFVMPGALQHSTNGIIYGARLYDKTLGFEFKDPRIRANVGEFYKQCLFYDLVLGFKSFDTIAQSTNILADMGPGSPARGMKWFNQNPAVDGVSDIITCRAAYTSIVAEMPAIIDNELTRRAPLIFPNMTAAAAKAKLEADLPVVVQAFHGAGATAAQVIQQRSLANAFLEARANLSEGDGDSFAALRAETQARNTYTGIAQQAMTWVPLLNIVLTVVFYAMFPVIFPLFLMPQTGPGALKGYLTGFFYLAAWGPLYVVLHMFVMDRETASMNAASPGGVRLDGMVGIDAVNGDTATIAGFLLMSVPFLAAGLARGAMAVASNATSMLAPAQSAAEAAAVERTTGNYAYGNVSYQNLTGNVAQRDQWTTAPNYQTGAAAFALRNNEGGLTRHYSDDRGGSNVYDTSGAISSLGFSAHIGQSGAWELRRSAAAQRQEASEIGRQIDVLDSQSNRRFQSSDTAHSTSRGTEERTAQVDTDSQSKFTGSNEQRSRGESGEQGTGTHHNRGVNNSEASSEDWQAGFTVSGGGGTPGGGGGEGGGGLVGARAGASAQGGGSISRSEREDVFNNRSTDEFGSFKKHSGRTDTDEKGNRASEDHSDSRSSAESSASTDSATDRRGTESASEHRESLSRRQSELVRSAETLDRIASYAETHNYRIDENAIPLIQPAYEQLRQSGELGALPHLSRANLSGTEREARNAAIAHIVEGLTQGDKAQFIGSNGLDRTPAPVAVDIPQGFSGGPGSRPETFPGQGSQLTPVTAVGASGIGVKPSADIGSLDQRIVAALPAIETTALRLGLPRPVITSGNDSTHMAGSRHYRDEAVDLRANTLSVLQGRQWASELRQELGGGYHVQYEYDPANPSNRHIHLQTRGS